MRGFFLRYFFLFVFVFTASRADVTCHAFTDSAGPGTGLVCTFSVVDSTHIRITDQSNWPDPNGHYAVSLQDKDGNVISGLAFIWGGTSTSGAVNSPLSYTVSAAGWPYGVIMQYSADTGSLSMPSPVQTCALSGGGSAAILTGQTYSGFATGAQAGNPYNISIISGGGGASINSATGVYTITAGPTGGLIHYKVWISAGGGYDRSNDAEGNIAVSLSKKVTVTIPANNSSYAIRYTLTQGGVSIGSYVQAAGHSAYILQVDVGANDGPVTLTATTTGIKKDGISLIDDPSQEVTEVISQTILPDPSGTPVPVSPPSTNDVKKPTDTNSGQVWSPGNQSTDPAQQTDLLTNQTFREGIDKLLDSQKTGVTDSDGLDVSALPAPVANVTVEGVQSLKGKLPVAPTLQDPGTVSVVSISLPLMTSLTATTSFSFSWDFSSWVTRLSWLRTFILGCISVWFFFGVNKQLRNSVAN